MNWFRKLKRWQKGGLIGLVIGIILAFLVHYLAIWTRDLFPYGSEYRIAFSYVYMILGGLDAWMMFSHYILAELLWLGSAPAPSLSISQEHYIFASAIVILYGGFGAIMGRVQQIIRPAWKWALTGLLIFLLLLFYALNFAAIYVVFHAPVIS
jgi:hypothetical protein